MQGCRKFQNLSTPNYRKRIKYETVHYEMKMRNDIKVLVLTTMQLSQNQGLEADVQLVGQDSSQTRLGMDNSNSDGLVTPYKASKCKINSESLLK